MSSRLAALAAELAALGERVAVLERAARVPFDDDRQLMRALVDRVGSAVFSSADLLAHAKHDPDLAAALRRHRTVKHVGSRLRELVDRPIAGVVLRRVTRDNRGTIWHVHVFDDMHTGAWPGAPAGG